MLGNDVVDLRDADSRPESFRPRFDARVFSPEERRAISRDRDPLARRWAHWAAKEAAYKLAKQIDPDLVFSPIRLQPDFDPVNADAHRRTLRCGIVRRSGPSSIAPTEVEVRSFETEDRVHVVALPIGSDWGAVDFAVERLESNTTDASAAVRALAVREISRSLGIDPRRLAVGRLGVTRSGWRVGPLRAELGDPRRSRIPTIELDGGPTSLLLSLSHHGRFISFAMTPRAEPAVHANRRAEHPAMLASAGATRP